MLFLTIWNFSEVLSLFFSLGVFKNEVNMMWENNLKSTSALQFYLQWVCILLDLYPILGWASVKGGADWGGKLCNMIPIRDQIYDMNLPPQHTHITWNWINGYCRLTFLFLPPPGVVSSSCSFFKAGPVVPSEMLFCFPWL